MKSEKNRENNVIRTVQRRLQRKRLVQKLEVKRLLGLMDEETRDAGLVEALPPGAAHHLQHVRQRQLHVAPRLGVVVLRALDHHQPRGEVHAPRERGRADQDLDDVRAEQLLHQFPVLFSEFRGLLKTGKLVKNGGN